MREATHEPTTGIAYSSLEAHQEIKPHKSTQYEMILKAMNEIRVPLTGRQLGNYSPLPLDRYEVQKRLSEMERLGMVRVCGRKHDAPKRPLLWEVTKAYRTESQFGV